MHGVYVVFQMIPLSLFDYFESLSSLCTKNILYSEADEYLSASVVLE